MDLVERLRESQRLYERAGVDGAEGALQAKEAADEIERLRVEIEAWRQRFPGAGFDGRCIVLSG